jgi:secretion/DNA translocation related TadE-like protein
MASLLTTIWIMVLVLMLSAAMALTGLWRAHARAGVAADLGALAGAQELLVGADAACSAARQVVLANGAEPVECSVTGVDVMVTAEVELPAGIVGLATGGRAIAVRNRAHATIEAV